MSSSATSKRSAKSSTKLLDCVIAFKRGKITKKDKAYVPKIRFALARRHENI